jgi:hypothetical protein
VAVHIRPGQTNCVHLLITLEEEVAAGCLLPYLEEVAGEVTRVEAAAAAHPPCGTLMRIDHVGPHELEAVAEGEHASHVAGLVDIDQCIRHWDLEYYQDAAEAAAHVGLNLVQHPAFCVDSMERSVRCHNLPRITTRKTFQV